MNPFPMAVSTPNLYRFVHKQIVKHNSAYVYPKN